MAWGLRTARRAARATAAAAGAALSAFWLAAAPAAAIERFAFETPGAPEELRAALRAASLLVAAEAEGVEDPQELLAAARADYGRLIGVLYAEGYYGPVIRILLDGREAAAIPPLAAPSRIASVVLRVEAGPPFDFGAVEVGPLAPGTDLPEGFRPGARARSGVIEAAAVAAVGGWRAAGHARAAIAGQEIVADHRSARLDARLRLGPGPRLRFGRLAVSGTTRMRPDRVAEIAGLPEGAVFDPEALARAAARLRRTGVFRSVSVTEAEAIREGELLDIGVAVVEEAPRRFGVGAELSSFDGIRLTGYWLHRNLLGGAERLRLEGEVNGIGAQEGGIGFRLAARLTRPATLTPDTDLGAGAFVERVDLPDYRADRGGVEAGLAHLLSERLRLEGGLAFRYEHVTDRLGTTDFVLLAAPLALVSDRRDSLLSATRGSYLEARATPFLGFAGADSGGQLRLDARAYHGLGEGRLVLAGRFQAGAVLGASLLGTPREMLFYSGGGGTVRGHPFQSLGVEADCSARSGEPDCRIRTGGRSFLGLSGELRTRVTDSIGLVAFADAGFVSGGLFEEGAWQAGAGLGLRYETGIGPIRLDLAAPVAGDTGRGLQIYLGIGQAF